MPDSPDRLAQLEQQIAALTQRIFRLEQALKLQAPAPPPIVTAEPVVAAPVAPQAPAATVPAPPRPPKPKADLEARIGSHWLNRIGIIAALIGAALLLQFAWDNQWIGPAGIVAIEMLAGIGFVFWSEGFRKHGYTYFSYGLKAIGIVFMYFSVFAGFHYYHLFPAAVAFAAMIVITASAATLALRQDAEIIAAYAIAGGFATPLLLSTGQNKEIQLFTYVTVLNLATLALVAVRPWRRLLIGSFAGTLILYIGWYSEYYDDTQLTTTVLFATIFFFIFALMPLVGRATWLRKEMQPHATVVFLPFCNAVAFFFELYAMLNRDRQDLLAWLAVGIAAFYILLARAIRGEGEEQGQQKLVRLLQVAIGVAFLTVAVPLKLSSHWITVGWLVESAVLIYIGVKNRVDLVKYFGIIALALGVFRLLVLDDFGTQHALVVNARFGIYLLTIAILGAIVYYGRRAGGNQVGVNIAIVAINLLALWALNLEVADYFGRLMSAATTDYGRFQGTWNYVQYENLERTRNFSYSAVWMIYGAALMGIGFWKRSAFLRWQAIILIAVTIVKVFTYDTWSLGTGWRILSFFALAVLLLGISFIYQRDWLKLSKKSAGEEASAARGGQ